MLRRVVVTWAEAATVGLKPGSHANTWGPILKPLAIAKGAPASRLYNGSTEVACIPVPEGLAIEWEDGQKRSKEVPSYA